MSRERRYIPVAGPEEVRLVRDAEQPTILEGHAAVFNELSEVLWGFREIIEPGAFDGRLEDDVRCLFNHDPNCILGRNKRTLTLGIDATGLSYRCEVPDTTTGRDLVVSVERGDVDQNSFGFEVDTDSWNTEGGILVRRIKRIARLWDVSPVTYPAYPQTDLQARATTGELLPAALLEDGLRKATQSGHADGAALARAKRKLQYLELTM